MTPPTEAAYAAYMTFAEIQPDPWQPTVISRYLQWLNAADSTVTGLEAENIRRCYDEPPTFRYYHGPPHGGFVGQPELPPTLRHRLSPRITPEQAQAILAIAGLFHDAAYKQIDALPDGSRAWPIALRDRISAFADYSFSNDKARGRIFTTTLTEQGRADPVTRMVAHIFGVGREGIAHNNGGNEFDSALAAAHFLKEKGVPPRHIVAVVAAIAATIPFRPAIGIDEAGERTDGRMGDLAERVKTTSLSLDWMTYQPDWTDTNDFMLLAVHLANRDISTFTHPDNLPRFISSGRAVKAEEIPELRHTGETTMSALARAAGLERSAPFLYMGLSTNNVPVPATDVPHLYIPRDEDGTNSGLKHAYPPYEVYQAAVAFTERNARLGALFFQAHEAGIATAASVATLIGDPDAVVPGMVHAPLWSADAVPRGDMFARLTPDERLVYTELMYGIHQTDLGPATTQRSPIGGLILGAAGQQGVTELSQRIAELRGHAKTADNPDPFSDPQTARVYLEDLVATIGRENFATIIRELRKVARSFAPEREASIADAAMPFIV